MTDLSQYEVWFITGSQHLYGPETLEQVDVNSRQIAGTLDDSSEIPCRIVSKPVLKTPDEITQLCVEASNSENCIGLIMWMHTFSPAKMWIRGLSLLNKPFVH